MEPLYFLRARYYGPTEGRFISRDPFSGIDEDPTSLHRYLYGAVDPVNNIDPSGEETIVGLMMATGIGNMLRAIKSEVDVAFYQYVKDYLDPESGPVVAQKNFMLSAAIGMVAAGGGSLLTPFDKYLARRGLNTQFAHWWEVGQDIMQGAAILEEVRQAAKAPDHGQRHAEHHTFARLEALDSHKVYIDRNVFPSNRKGQTTREGMFIAGPASESSWHAEGGCFTKAAVDGVSGHGVLWVDRPGCARGCSVERGLGAVAVMARQAGFETLTIIERQTNGTWTVVADHMNVRTVNIVGYRRYRPSFGTRVPRLP
jgi:hypothetical protein